MKTQLAHWKISKPQTVGLAIAIVTGKVCMDLGMDMFVWHVSGVIIISANRVQYETTYQMD